MGTIAKIGIINGKKVPLHATAGEVHSVAPFDASLFGSGHLVELAEKTVRREPLSAADIADIVSIRSIPVLLKLLSLAQSTAGSADPVHTLFLPVDTWLDSMDPNAVINRAVGHLRRQRTRPNRVVIQIKDFSDLEHLWPDILDGIRSNLTEDAELVAPDPFYLMEWINRHDSTGSRTVRRFQFEQKLHRLLEAGFDALEPTGQRALLQHIEAAGFPVEAVSSFGNATAEEMGRDLARLTQIVGDADSIGLYSWTPVYQTEAEVPQAELDLFVLRAHLIGGIIFPAVLHGLHGAAVSPAVFRFLQAVGIRSRLCVTSDTRTARRTGALLVETEQQAVVLSGSFCSNEG